MSKDLIIERVFFGTVPLFGVNIGMLVFVLSLLAALITAIYMSRMMYLTFWSPSRVDAETKAHLHEQPFVMSAPLLLLGFGAMAVGCVWFGLVPQLNLLGTYLSRVFEPAQTFAISIGQFDPGAPHGAWPFILAAVGGLVLAPVGWLIARLFYRRGPRDAEVKPLQGFADVWINGLDRVYDVLFVLPTRALSWVLYRVVDQLLIGGVVRSVGSVCGFLGEGYAAIQRGRLRVSVLLSVTGAVVLVVYVIAPILFPGA